MADQDWQDIGPIPVAVAEKPHIRNSVVNIPAAFTLAPHSELINHRGCFSATAGI
jgi:hypothetical protein